MVSETRLPLPVGNGIPGRYEFEYRALDNLNTHSRAAFYEAFSPRQARYLTKKLEFHYTPEHSSWLNPVLSEVEGMAEVEATKTL